MTGGASPGPVPRAELRVWGDAACRKVHDATCRVLAETGIEVRHPRALELLRRAGAQVSGTRARLPRDLVDQAVASAPRSFVLHGRAADGSLDLELADGRSWYGTGPGLPLRRRPGRRSPARAPGRHRALRRPGRKAA